MNILIWHQKEFGSKNKIRIPTALLSLIGKAKCWMDPLKPIKSYDRTFFVPDN